MAMETVYGTQIDLTITLASLASDTALLAGRESTAVSNLTTKAIDYELAGQLTTGTSPTEGRTIEVWAYGAISDTPDYPNPLTGTDSNRTIVGGLKGYTLRLVALIDTSATSNYPYGFGPVSLNSLFGGVVPSRWGTFVLHSTGVTLNATGGNHFITATPIKYADV